MTYHKVLIVGNLGRDPEMRYTPSGQAVTNMSVASTETWVKDSVKNEKTIWWRVAVFGKAGEACNEYLKKGSKVLVEGRMNGDEHGNPKIYEKKDGTKGASFEITALTVKFLSSAGSRTDAGESEGEGQTQAAPAVATTEEDFPF